MDSGAGEQVEGCYKSNVSRLIKNKSCQGREKNADSRDTESGNRGMRITLHQGRKTRRSGRGNG